MGRVPGVRRALPGERERFDALVIDVVERIDLRWRERLGPVEYAVEEMPVVPRGWDGEVPLASVIAGDGQPPRVVVFRRPVEHRAEDRGELAALVHAVVAEQVADLLGIDPEDLDAPE